MNVLNRSLHLIWIALLYTAPQAIGQNFINQIPIPPQVDAGSGPITLEARKFTTWKFNPNMPSDTLNGGVGQNGIETWGYNVAGDTSNKILGPTLIWHSGQSTQITVVNKLPQPTTTHWHGAEVPAEMDGGPHQPFDPDSSWSVNFTCLDSASTMWYHPHYHNNTYPQVQFGLSGLIMVEEGVDPINDAMPHTYGVDDIPLVIGDLGFKLDTLTGQYHIDTAKSKHPVGIVNGVAYPYVEVPAHMVRLRILNGSTRKGIQYGVSDGLTDNNLNNYLDMVLVGVDGGYMTKPDTFKTFLTGPGAREEILLDLTNHIPGDVVYLRNRKDLMPGYIVGSPNGFGTDTTAGNAFLQLRIIPDPVGYTPIDVVAPYTHMYDHGLDDTTSIDNVRLKELVGAPGSGFTINGTTYHMDSINDIVCENAREIWTIDNQSTVAHPFHIHKIQFRVLNVVNANNSPLDVDSLGLNGPKDDILVHPGWKMRFLGVFDHYPNAIDASLSYMYHCHILTHEDIEGGGMMHQFVVTDAPPCSVGLEKPGEDALTLFPNPSTGELFINGAKEVGTVRIYDLQGRLLREQTLERNSDRSRINTEGLSSGLFMVIWQGGEKTHSWKWLKM